MSKRKEKSGVQKLRERHERIKLSVKPSKELLEIFFKKEMIKEEKKKTDRPCIPEDGASWN